MCLILLLHQVSSSEFPSLGVGHSPGLLHLHIIRIWTRGGSSDNTIEMTPTPGKPCWPRSRTARYTQYVQVMANKVPLVYSLRTVLCSLTAPVLPYKPLVSGSC